MSKHMITSFNTKEELIKFAKVSGFDLGRTDRAIKEWEAAQALKDEPTEEDLVEEDPAEEVLVEDDSSDNYNDPFIGE